MKFKCQKEDLVRILSSVSPITGSVRSTYISSSNVLIETAEGGVFIHSSNGEMSLSAFIPAEVERAGRTAIVQEKLFNFVKQLPEGPILLEQTGEQKTLVKAVSKRKVSAHIVGVAVEDMSNIRKFDSSEKSIIIDKLYFKKMFKKTRFCVSSDDTKYTLNGVYLECDEKEIKMVAIDGRRLAIIQNTYPKHEHVPFNAILPLPLLDTLERTAMIEGPMSFYFKDNTLYFKFDNIEMSSAVLSGKFPDYNMFIPKENQYGFKCSTKDLLSAIGAASVLIDIDSKKLFGTLSSGKLQINSQNADYGDAEEELMVIYSGEEKRFALNYDLLSNILKEIETPEVNVVFNDVLAPFLIREEGREEYRYILMPMKVSQS